MNIQQSIYDGLGQAYRETTSEGRELLEKIRLMFPITGCKSIFDKPFDQNNIMCKCKLSCIQQDDVVISLAQLNRPMDNMFFDKKVLPSLLMCLPTFAPVVLCSFKGRITMTGGNSLEEIQYCLSYYCMKLIYYLKHIYPYRDYYIEDFCICNRLCTSRLPYNIDLFHCSNEIQRLSNSDPRFHGFRVKYQQEQINLVYLYPPSSLFGQSLRISIGSEGGINIFGAKKDFEVLAMIHLLTILLQNSIRNKHPVQLVRDQMETDKDQKTRKLLKKKNKLISKWQNLTSDKPPVEDPDAVLTEE
jgi:TATA-box binding protein (TBP) (component of TFIID and TFIIIB)